MVPGLRAQEDMRVQEDSLTVYLDEVRSGLPLAREGACRLLRCPEDELPALLAAALELKQHFKPGVITYSRKVFIPLTNLCRDYCGYCTFRRDPGQPGAHTMTPDEVMEVVRAGERMGCTEALFSLGDKPEQAFPEMRATLRHLGYKSTLHYLEAMCERVLRESSLLPHPNPGLMSAEWLERLARSCSQHGSDARNDQHASAGEGAAHDNAPDKDPAKRLRVIEEAGGRRCLSPPASDRDRRNPRRARGCAARHPRAARALRPHPGSDHPEFPRQAGDSDGDWPEPDRGDMLRTLAVARLLMPDVNIQAPPNLSDPHYADLLDGGINDWGGVSPLTPDFINPEKPWPHLEELGTEPKPRGYELRQRLPVYPEFLTSLSLAARLAGGNSPGSRRSRRLRREDPRAA